MIAPIEPDVIAPLNFRQGDERWTEYRARAQNDLYFLASVVWGYGELVPMTIGAHGLLCKFIERQTGVPALDTAKYRKIELGRGWGKSTVARAYAMQRLLRDPNTAILLANEREQTAADFLAEIKSHFESNAFFRALFPDIVPENVKHTMSRYNARRKALRSEEHTSELQSPCNLVCRLLLEKKKVSGHILKAISTVLVSPRRMSTVYVIVDWRSSPAEACRRTSGSSCMLSYSHRGALRR